MVWLLMVLLFLAACGGTERDQPTANQSTSMPPTAASNTAPTTTIAPTTTPESMATSMTTATAENTPLPPTEPADTATPTPASAVNEPGDGKFTRTQIFLIALEDNGQSGEMIGCGDSVLPVEVAIEPTVAPLTAALNKLLGLNEQFYGQSGLYNAFYQSDLSVEGIDIDQGTAVIHLTGTLQLSGACDNPRAQAQLEQTALQYNTVDAVSITINGEPLASILSGQ